MVTFFVLEVAIITYSKNIYYKYLKNADIHGAITYLKKNNKTLLVKKYNSIFENEEWLAVDNNKVLNNIGIFYQEYYKDIFWLKIPKNKCEKKFKNKIMVYFNLNKKYSYSIQQIEYIIKNKVKKQGYFFVGDYTSGYLGPYIWKNNTIEDYIVELPFENVQLSLCMMDNFIMKSWLSYISFNAIGTGGWVSGYEKKIFCVKNIYEDFIDKPIFTISLLKHEAQHICDRKKYRFMSSKDLEYRAKLVELVYYPNIKKFIEFFYEASDKDKRNTHCYASYWVVANLSKKIFDIEYQYNLKRWLNSINLIKKYALNLLQEHTDICENNRNRTIDVI